MEDSLLMSSSFAVHGAWSRVAHPTQRSGHPRSRAQNLPLHFLLVATFSAVTIILTLSTCKSVRSRHQFSGVTQRRLSEGSEGIDDSNRSMVDVCLELEEEVGILEQRASSSSANDPPTRVTALVSMLSGDAASTGSLQEAPPGGGQLGLSTQLMEGRKGLDSPDKLSSRIHTPSLQAPAERPGPNGGAPALDPNSWIETIPSISGQAEKQEEWTETFSVTLEESNMPALPFSKPTGPLKLRDLLECGGFENHPYVRLPVLKDGVVPRYIKASSLLEQPQRRLSPHLYLLTLRSLFAKKTLNQTDVNLLVNAVERLVTACWMEDQKREKSTSRAYTIRELGNCFMVFDSIVCTFQLLGEYMQPSQWWQKFTASFETKFPPLDSRPRGTRVTKYSIFLTKRLVAALQIYKTGQRPSRREVVELKTLLFCSPVGRHGLTDPKWNPWRDDAECS